MHLGLFAQSRCPFRVSPVQTRIASNIVVFHLGITWLNNQLLTRFRIKSVSFGLVLKPFWASRVAIDIRISPRYEARQVAVVDGADLRVLNSRVVPSIAGIGCM